ncbi:MAG TPA: dehydrogenase, partial [Planctomycetia bacterium]|nr:dehydrogenase [Planctomycetia bacterium]
FGPAMQAAAIDFLFRRPQTQTIALDAIEAGRIPASAVGLERRDMMINFGPDGPIKTRAAKIFGKAAGDRGAVIEKYKNALATKGDSGAGRLHFRKLCVTCHRLEGVGANVGPELADVRQRPSEALLSDLLDPNRAVEPRFASYVASDEEGKLTTGLLAAETATAIVLRKADGKDETIPRAGLVALKTTGRSLMPEGLEKDLTPRQVADLIAYLKALPAK